MKRFKLIDVAYAILAITLIAAMATPGGIVKKAYANPDNWQDTVSSAIESSNVHHVVEETAEVEETRTPTECVHDFGEYEMVVAPGINKNGIESRVCSNCEKIEEREYICAHKAVSLMNAVDESCANPGCKKYVCNLCGTILKTETIEQLSCSYGDWYSTKDPTHLENGEMNRQCSGCGTIESYSYAMEMVGANSIYIPGTGINHVFHVGRFTQADVDRYDIVYANSRKDCENPFILGHNTGTMGKLQYTKVGQFIYVSINGTIEIYEVIVSEFGISDSSRTDIIGQTTGTSVWDTVGEKTLRLYTCHGDTNGRWIVLAEFVGVI